MSWVLPPMYEGDKKKTLSLSQLCMLDSPCFHNSENFMILVALCITPLHPGLVYMHPNIFRQIPWPNCDNQFQIMYQLGSGKSPPLSRNDLSDEGQDFLQRCFHIQPKDRWTANRLLDHPFVKVCT